MFGKTLAEYLRFQRVILALVVAAFVVRLALSMAGVANTTTRWVSVTVVLLIGIVYYGVAVYRTGFGSYKQLYPLMLIQGIVGEGLVALAIVLAILTGRDNIYTVPEYSGGGDGKTWLHVGAHLFLGVIVLPLASWAVGSLIMLVTRKVAPRPA